MADALDFLLGQSGGGFGRPADIQPIPMGRGGFEVPPLPFGRGMFDLPSIPLGGLPPGTDLGVIPIEGPTSRRQRAEKADKDYQEKQQQKANARQVGAQARGVAPAEVPAEYRATLEAAAAQYGVDPTLLAAQLKQENHFQAQGTSSAGAQGIAQFIPATAAAYGVNVNDPHSSIQGMAHYMSDLLQQYGGNQQEALAAYNGGPRAVQALRAGTPFNETRTYLDRVQGYQQAYRAQSAAPAPAAAPAVAPGGSVFPVVGYRGPISPHWGGVPGGMDIMAPEGTPVVAMRGGRVSSTGYYPNSGGNYAEIAGDDGNMYYYAHMQGPAQVAPGQPVEAGTPLGAVGRTGNAASTPPHLHIGIGPTISQGVGPQGGTGGSFDATSLLRAAYDAALAAYANGAP